MKCPSCGHEIEEGHLICEVCGSEIKIVPEYDPTVENDIEGILTHIKGDIFGDDAPGTDGAVQPEQEKLARRKLLIKRIAFVCGGASFVLLLALVIASTVISQSLTHRLSKCRDYMKRGEHGKAVSYMERACSDYPESIEARIMLAEAYEKNGDRENEENLLLYLRKDRRLGEDELEQVEDMLVPVYIERQDYQKASEILSSCNEETRHKYREYAADSPGIDMPGGQYSSPVTITLSTDGEGKIYYTTDGERPGDGKGTLYDSPFTLRSGKHEVQAVYVNPYGIVSDEARVYYEVDGVFVEAPEVNPPSGDYTLPQYIDVYINDLNKTVYFTTDGSDPSENDQRYSKPIIMPAGNSNFSFVTVDSNGNKSEAVRRSYNLRIAAGISEDFALNTLRLRLIQVGYLADASGLKTGTTDRMVYERSGPVRASNGLDYYTFTEYVENTAGSRVSTGVIMGVEALTGGCAIMTKKAGGYNAAHF